jgi:hypothetical protein
MKIRKWVMNVLSPTAVNIRNVVILLYVNDISNISERLSYILFADDTNIFVSGKSLSGISDVLNHALVLINEWLQINKLSLKHFQNTIYDNVLSKEEIQS